MPYSIYTLSNPNTGSIFYVGMTLNLRKRIPHHTYASAFKRFKRLGKMSPCDHYLIFSKIKPVVHVIEQVYGNVRNALDREAFWISFMVAHGFSIVNKGNVGVSTGMDYSKLPLIFSPVEIDSGLYSVDSEILEEIETTKVA